MSYLSTINAVLTMGIYMMIGYLITKKVRFQQDTKDLMVTLIVNVAVPSLILSSFSKLTIRGDFYTKLLFVFFFAVLLYLLAIVIGMTTTRILKGSKQRAKEMAVASAQANTGFIGIPLCAALFGPEAVILAVVYDIGTGVSMWTFSMLVLQKKFSFHWQTLKKIINLPMIAFAAGLILNLLQWHLPNNLLEVTHHLGMLASPLAMIYIGSFIPQLMKKRKLVEPVLLSLVSTIRLFLIPIVTAIALRLLHLDDQMTQVILIMSMMPIGAMVPILFAMHGADEEFGASATVYSTLISLFTIPIMVMICWQLVGIS